MKRSISDMAGAQLQDGSESKPRKRSRLDNLAHDGAMAVQVEPHPDLPGEDTDLGQGATTEEIGLRSAEDCVADVFAADEENEGEQVCNLCV
jgi:hypothetical protein